MSMKATLALVHAISNRSVLGGGFSEHLGSFYRVDATVWAILALKDANTNSDFLSPARSRLANGQQKDGRVCLTQDHPQVFWPTALAVLAWHGSDTNRQHRELAIQFLLDATSKHWKKSADSPLANDTFIRGWAWIEDTFAWVEPTSLSILALSLSGYSKHERVQEAVRLLMDRQLPSGGWNYGNTVVYGQELYPQVETTGMALTALAGQVEKKEIQRSLVFLKSQAVSSRTPLSLGWALFGLGAWGERPPEAKRWLAECLSRQKKYGAYGTTLLSLILLAYEARGGFLETISWGLEGK